MRAAVATLERSYIPPRGINPERGIEPLVMKSVEGYQDLARLGIGLDEKIIRKMISELQGASNVYSVAMDAMQQGLTQGSIPTPVQFLQNWLPGFVKIITAARKIDELIGISTSGNWSDEEIVQGVMETTGTAQPYGDLTNVPLSSWNTNFERRTVVRFEEGMRVGILEEARAAAIRVNSAESKREAASLSLEIQRNAVGFYGYNDGLGRTYGFLTDPNLPSYITVNAGASASTLWANKTFLEITADIRQAIVQLRTQSDDTIDPESVNITLALPTACVDRLSVTSNYGNSVRDWLTKTYPRVRVVSAPQLNAANGGANVFYLYAEQVNDLSTDDGRTFAQVIPSKFQVLGVAKLAKGYEEDYSNATAGALLKRPYAVTRYTGI